MAASILTYRPAEVYTPVHPENHICQNCLYWQGDYFNKTHARVAGGTVWVGQCCNDEDDMAPHAEAGGAEPVVFTQAHSYCGAFKMHPEVAADIEEERDTYRRLDLDLCRDGNFGSRVAMGRW